MYQIEIFLTRKTFVQFLKQTGKYQSEEQVDSIPLYMEAVRIKQSIDIDDIAQCIVNNTPFPFGRPILDWEQFHNDFWSDYFVEVFELIDNNEEWIDTLTELIDDIDFNPDI